jgi:hypothetical protein
MKGALPHTPAARARANFCRSPLCKEALCLAARPTVAHKADMLNVCGASASTGAPFIYDVVGTLHCWLFGHKASTHRTQKPRCSRGAGASSWRRRHRGVRRRIGEGRMSFILMAVPFLSATGI